MSAFILPPRHRFKLNGAAAPLGDKYQTSGGFRRANASPASICKVWIKVSLHCGIEAGNLLLSRPSRPH